MPYNTILVKKNKICSTEGFEHCGEFIFQWFGALADVMPENELLLLRNEMFGSELDAHIDFQSKDPISVDDFGDIVFEDERWYPGLVRVYPDDLEGEVITEVWFNGERVY
jgi:hypothetical protein